MTEQPAQLETLVRYEPIGFEIVRRVDTVCELPLTVNLVVPPSIEPSITTVAVPLIAVATSTDAAPSQITSFALAPSLVCELASKPVFTAELDPWLNVAALTIIASTNNTSTTT